MKSKQLSFLVFLSLLTSLLVFIQAPNSFALSQGSTTDGDGLGGAGGIGFTNTDCDAGSVVTRVSTSNTTHDGTNSGYITAFSFVCTALAEDLTLSATTVTKTILNTPNANSSCPSGTAAVGIKVISGSVIADAGVICGKLPGRSNIDTSIAMARAQTSNASYTCPTNAYLVGFGGSKGSGIDKLIPRCAKFPVVTQTLSATTINAGSTITITYSHFCPTAITSNTFYDQVTGPGPGTNTVVNGGSSSDGNLTYTVSKTYTINVPGTWRSSPYMNRSGCTGMVSATQATFTVVDVTPPNFTSNNSFTVEENFSTTSNAATIKVSESSTVTISSGVDMNLFNIAKFDSITATIRFKTSPDYEAPADSNSNNVYEITLTATDAAGNAGTQSITITVTDFVEFSSFNSLTISTPTNFRQAVTLTASVTVASKVTFRAANIIISGCKNKLATGSGSTYTVTCTWKPSKRGAVVITATSIPTNLAISSATATPVSVVVGNRGGSR